MAKFTNEGLVISSTSKNYTQLRGAMAHNSHWLLGLAHNLQQVVLTKSDDVVIKEENKQQSIEMPYTVFHKADHILLAVDDMTDLLNMRPDIVNNDYEVFTIEEHISIDRTSGRITLPYIAFARVYTRSTPTPKPTTQSVTPTPTSKPTAKPIATDEGYEFLSLTQEEALAKLEPMTTPQLKELAEDLGLNVIKKDWKKTLVSKIMNHHKKSQR